MICPTSPLTRLQYSNVYVTTPDIRLLAEDEDMQEECLAFVAKHGQFKSSHEIHETFHSVPFYLMEKPIF